MKKNNPIRDKSYKFALRIVNLYKFLTEEKREYIISKQVLRSGTSIGANIEEATGGLSDREFLAKMGIAYKEARETMFWIKLLKDSDFITIYQAKSLLDDCEEICRILGSIQITTKKKLGMKVLESKSEDSGLDS